MWQIVLQEQLWNQFLYKHGVWQPLQVVWPKQQFYHKMEPITLLHTALIGIQNGILLATRKIFFNESPAVSQNWPCGTMVSSINIFVRHQTPFFSLKGNMCVFFDKVLDTWSAGWREYEDFDIIVNCKFEKVISHTKKLRTVRKSISCDGMRFIHFSETRRFLFIISKYRACQDVSALRWVGETYRIADESSGVRSRNCEIILCLFLPFRLLTVIILILKLVSIDLYYWSGSRPTSDTTSKVIPPK